MVPSVEELRRSPGFGSMSPKRTMPLHYPRSIVSLILIGFAVVLAPFVIAVITAIIQVDRFAQESRSAVLDVDLVSEQSQLLADQAVEMQRALGQYIISGDPAFLDIYRNRRASFREALSGLSSIEESSANTGILESLDTDEARIYERVDSWSVPLSPQEAASARADLASVATQSRAILAASDQLAQDNVNEITIRAEAMQRLLLVFAAAAVPATVVLVTLFTILISRPMRELGRAIRRLGGYSYSEKITVAGPQDITALAGELEWLRKRISALEQQKSNFLQHISHELKTPLTTIREGSELLCESFGDDNAEEAEIARLLRQNGLYLQGLIDDLLRFARTQDLATDLKFEPQVDLARLIADSIASLSVLAESKQLTIEQALAPVSASCDASRIRTVIDNLLTNAIKYTPERGRVEVKLAEHSGQAFIDVSDSGPGVAEKDRRRIFEPFQQGSASYESSVKGTGLGLSIAREHVSAHQGTIELVDSQRGGHFRVVLPLEGPQFVDAAH